jgi:hypothetical protein
VKLPKPAGIPWLQQLAREDAEPVFRNPFGGRVQREPSTEGTERILIASEPPKGSENRTRARFHFANGQSIVLEAMLAEARREEDPDRQRPGLVTPE